ncbi:TonB-dependent receptor plug [Leadbetterella byssophila DSM 17132]|uniref:TonB-dependent receptor plug n=1 Tax=Leadbetterella byssophila (strain DSM 17132 / JCM 16389 / KACC 11308 / NBRC 106382 / 4M15) TaxID=649349 RepID=E4RRH1_LEAB4|nr:TonB-dependent receptor [Leadbetterella byssophila]ADQ15800.1 TonB-dependent receptor plug [Leadbetterella byssophila DSM 17132]
MNVCKLFQRALSLVLLLFVYAGVMAQSDVKGTVTDVAGEALPGVTVSVKGGTVGTMTDVDGNFTIRAQRGETLVFSYVGYVTKEALVSGTAVNVQLEEDRKTLDEVIVVGYGSMAKKDITSSITSIKQEDFNQGVYTDPAQLLQGKVPGLTISNNNSDPNASPSVTLRGSSTLRSGAAMEPYYVIDGVPGASLSLVSPDDIVSIDVLRDASATAIYGSKAANGVIIVTTKRGKSGQASVTYSGYVSVDKIRKRLEMMNAQQYKDFVLNNGFSLDPYDDTGADTDWQKEVSRTGFSQNHNISINGGNEKTRYSTSVNYLRNLGVIKGSGRERYVARAFVETQAMQDKLTVSFNVNASTSTRNNVPAQGQGLSVYDAMYYYLPMSSVKRPDGSWFEYPQRSQYANPVSLLEESTILSKDKVIQAHARGSYQIFKDLRYNLDLSYQNSQFNYANYYTSKSMVAAGMNGKSTRSAVEGQRKVMEMNLAYDKILNNRHKVGLLGGYSWEENNDNDGFQLTTYNYYSDDLSYHNPGMANNIDLNGFGGYNLSTLRMISFYGRANYSLDGKYLFQATVRRDGSSAFGANNRWATFPSVSFAWRISDEEFAKGTFDDLKFRIGYGVSGNSLGFDVFTATQVYGATGWFTNSEGNLVRTLGAVRNSNPDLRWEKTDMLNIGLDFAILKNRLSGTIEVYNKNTSDLIYDYPVSTTKYLYSYLTTNVGEINNKGIEFTLSAVPVKKKSFSWNTGLTLSHNKNVVKKISNQEFSVNYLNLSNLDGAGQSGMTQQRVMEGYPIGTFYTWEWAGYNDQGVSVYYVHDPATGERTGELTTTPQDKDRAYTGSAQPKLVLGWNNNFNYKRFGLTATFQGLFGNKIMNGTRARHSNVVGNAGNKNLLADVLKTEKVTDYNAHFLSDRYLEKGDYLRLAQLSGSYSIGKIGSGIKNARVFMTVNNAFVLTKYKGLDPEVFLGGITPGIDNRQTYPRTRTVMFGLNLNL